MNVDKLKPVIEYWDNGNKQRYFFVDAHNNIQGEYKRWHKNGQLYVHCFCENGNLRGEYKSWYENGQLYIHCFFENGVRLDIPKKDLPKTKDEYVLFCLKYGNLPLLGSIK